MDRSSPDMPQDEPQPEETARQYQCPGCGEEVPAESGRPLLQCPQCGEQFFIPSDHEPSVEAAEEEGHELTAAETDREAELSEVRIRQVSSLRRGLIRTQSWWIIGAGTCLVAAAMLIQMIVKALLARLRLLPLGYALGVLASLMIFVYCLRRMLEVGREIRASKMPDPPTPPDFSGLSDGSQQWTNLDRLSSGE